MLIVAVTLPASARLSGPDYAEIIPDGNLFENTEDLVPGIPTTQQIVIRNNGPSDQLYFLKAAPATLAEHGNDTEALRITQHLLEFIEITLTYYPVEKDGTVVTDSPRVLYKGKVDGSEGMEPSTGDALEFDTEAIRLGYVPSKSVGLVVADLFIPETLEIEYQYKSALFHWIFYEEAGGIIGPIDPGRPDPGLPDKPDIRQPDPEIGREITVAGYDDLDDKESASDITVLDHSDIPTKLKLPQTGSRFETVGKLAPILLLILIALLGLLIMNRMEARKTANKK